MIRRPPASTLFPSTTLFRAVCVQLYVTVRAGRFGSVAVPVNVTAAAEATVCAAPAFAVGAPIGGLTVTVVVAVVVSTPLPTVTVKPSVTGAMPAVTAGAAKVATAAFAFVNATVGDRESVL